MHPDKAPGPDGFNPAFYQHFWSVCGDDIFEAAREWLDRGYFPSNLNDTNICLIPKCDNPTSMKELRPISLCNVLYKMVSKVLANRLKVCLDKCVGEEQSAFIEGRSILDNALIAIEVVHALKRKTKGASGDLALKIDISKAYDRVDWGFMRGMLERLGFADRWIHWMMLCVSSVNYSILVNYEKVGPIVPGRGLRQGDPLSPYLFILVTEGLSTLIKKFVARGDIHGVKVCRGAPSVSHLLFADDCFLFCRANLVETRHLMNVLNIYAEASGQEINMSKSEVFFSRNISVAAQEDLSRFMGVRHVLGTSTYLGLPSMVGRSKKSIFTFVKDRVWKRINSWRGRALSKAGKEVMIKSVLQSIPTYVMSIYLLPETLIKEVERMINSFWWGGGSQSGGIKWMAWDKMAYPKEYGGLGFRNLHLFNMAMVAKQCWNFITKPNTLVAKVYKARYFPNSSLFASTLGHNPSYAWRSIWNSRHVIMNGCRWKIGDGTRIKVMNDPWLKKDDGKWVQSPQVQGVANLCVNQLLCQNEKPWDSNKIHSLFPSYVANSIIAMPLFDDVGEDHLVWDDDMNGNYSVKSGYNLLLEPTIAAVTTQGKEDWKWIWKIQAPPKAKHLLWRICNGCLPTRVRLQEKHVQCPVICPLCELEEEDDWHVIYGCESSKIAWHGAGLLDVIAPYNQQNCTVKECILHMCRNASRSDAGKAAMLIWILWSNRNNCVWNHEKETGQQLGYRSLCLWFEWSIVQREYYGDVQQVPQQQLIWQPPPRDKFKCNVDVGIHNEERKSSSGWCVRDHRGNFIMGGSSWINGKCSSNEGEALALLEAMTTLQFRGYNDVIFETDAQNIVGAIRSRKQGISEFSVIINKIKCLLSLCSGFEVKLIRRQANRVAHTIARASLSWPRRHVFDVVPLCIHNLLSNEMI
ncbi:hypothetical protein QL285_071338 [Trifolium repens]|nr:hypothetical protein QL285_071338 [Trifolium repens]